MRISAVPTAVLLAICHLVSVAYAAVVDDFGDPRTVETKDRSRGQKTTTSSAQQLLLRGSNTEVSLGDPGIAQSSSTCSDQNLPNYFVHIPKAGGNSAAALFERDIAELCPDMQMCNHYVGDIKDWKRWISWPMKCTLHMSESPYYPEAALQFSIVRNPIHHVLSQYFHCTESQWRKPSYESIPPLDEWLQYWIDVRGNNTADDTLSRFPLLYTYDCYKPINLQSTMLSATKDLKSKFDVVGLTDELERSTCLISIKLMGAVPSRCDCTARESTADGDRSGTVPDEVPRIDHGSTHHGDTYPLTKHEQKLIESLTDKDVLLYDSAQRYFRKLIQQIEREYAFDMC